MVKSLARFFRGLNMAMGVTTLPANASPEQERKFVFSWLGIIGFLTVLFFVVLYLFISQL